MRGKASILLPVLCCMSVLAAQIPKQKGPKVILFLIDGCRWDYINDPHLKGIPKMIKNGVRAPYVTPVYPANSYPNWYSIVTGLYAESHGFVGNEMYDQETNEFFLMYPDKSSTKPFWWNEAEPIWITAEKNGMHSALYWWVGCEVEIKESHPTICEEHRYGPGTEEEKKDILLRIDDILQLFKREELSLAQIYYGPIDFNGHHFGPNSSETRQAVSAIDDVLDQVQQRIESEGLKDQVNIIVVSDHGMTESNDTNTQFIHLEPFADKIEYQVSSGTASMILPKPGMLDELYSELKNSFENLMDVYKKEEIPDQYHLKKNGRVLPLLLQAKKGYLIKRLSIPEKIKYSSKTVYKGVHGYVPFDVEDMRTVFFARGPAFKKGFISDPLSNVDHYNLMCHILGMTPRPNNGSWENVKSMLIPDEEFVDSSSNVIENGNILISLLICMMIYCALK